MAAKKKGTRNPSSPSRNRSKPRRKATSASSKRKRATSKRKKSRTSSVRSDAKAHKRNPRPRAKVKAKPAKARQPSKSAQKKRPSKRPSKAQKARSKPKRPRKAEEVSLFWQGYFHDALGAIKEQLQREGFASRIKTWKNEDRADAILTVEADPEQTADIQTALSNAALDYLTQGGFFVSFAYAGHKGVKGSPTLSQAGQTAETYPTQKLSAAIETAEGTRNVKGVLERLEPFLAIEQIKLRLHWNAYGEQPERMG